MLKILEESTLCATFSKAKGGTKVNINHAGQNLIKTLASVSSLFPIPVVFVQSLRRVKHHQEMARRD